MNVTLFDDRILVKPDQPEQVSEGGIIIPDTADQNNKKINGTVIKCGEGRIDQSTGEFFPMPLKEGFIVRFPAYMVKDNALNIEGEDYLLMRERDIDCIVED